MTEWSPDPCHGKSAKRLRNLSLCLTYLKTYICHPRGKRRNLAVRKKIQNQNNEKFSYMIDVMYCHFLGQSMSTVLQWLLLNPTKITSVSCSPGGIFISLSLLTLSTTERQLPVKNLTQNWVCHLHFLCITHLMMHLSPAVFLKLKVHCSVFSFASSYIFRWVSRKNS